MLQATLIHNQRYVCANIQLIFLCLDHFPQLPWLDT